MDARRRLAYLQRMGITLWLTRNRKRDERPLLDMGMAPSSALNLREQRIAALDWKGLYAEVAGCRACDLYKTRIRPVFGVGNPEADLLVVGEAPGANEDKQGEPFVGRAGQLLTSMLLAIGLKREDIYITNILKSRPPNNRDPSSGEVAACTPYLLRQISLIRPRLIVAVGRIAAQFLLNSKANMSELRGRLFHYGALKIPLLVTYHPAYLLRAPREKRKAWQDVQYIRDQLERARNSGLSFPRNSD